MIDPKNPFDYKQPQIHFNATQLGPHHQRVITLPKFEREKKYTPSVWVVAAFIVGFAVSATIIDSMAKSYTIVRDTFLKTDVIAFTPPVVEKERHLGSDDEVEVLDFNQEIKDGTYYSINPAYAVPRTSSLSFLVADVDTGNTILEKGEGMILPIASVSKLMTAVITKEEMDPHTPIKITRSSIDTYGTTGGLSVGEETQPAELMYPLLIESSNDAAAVLADSFGTAAFLKLMNAKARDLGMLSTSYEDPSGLSPHNVSSTKDLLILARFINSKMPELWDITRVREYGILGHVWQNGNNQLKKVSFIGGKNGFTDEALRTSVSVYDVPLKIKGKDTKEKKRIAVIVLKSNDRDGDLSKLLRYVETNIGFEENSQSEIVPVIDKPATEITN